MDRRLVKEKKKTREKQPFRDPCNKRQSEGRETETERERNHEKTRERATSARHCGIHAGFVLVYGTVSCQWQDGVEADRRVADCRCLYWSPEKAALPLGPSILDSPSEDCPPFTVMHWLLAL